MVPGRPLVGGGVAHPVQGGLGSRTCRAPTMSRSPASSRAVRSEAEERTSNQPATTSPSMPWAAWKASTTGMVVVSTRSPSQHPTWRGRPWRSTMTWGPTHLSLEQPTRLRSSSCSVSRHRARPPVGDGDVIEQGPPDAAAGTGLQGVAVGRGQPADLGQDPGVSALDVGSIRRARSICSRARSPPTASPSPGACRPHAGPGSTRLICVR